LNPFLFFPILIPAAQIAPPAAMDREVLAMGTRFALHLEGGPQAAEILLAEVARIEAAGSTWRQDSVFSRLNGAGGKTVVLDAEWIQLLGRVQAWSHDTAGAFDPVLGSLIKAWGLRVGGRVPSDQEWLEAKEAAGSALLHIDAQAQTLQLSHAQAGIEEGGFLKGYALDAARTEAERSGARRGVLNLGGQVLAWGRPFETEIAHPRHRNQAVLRISLTNASLSSTGCSERGRHILDPRTGSPCPDWGAISVICPSALDADVLSTALYVMGPEQGFAWAETRNLAAAFLSHHGPIRTTSALRALNPTLLAKDLP